MKQYAIHSKSVLIALLLFQSLVVTDTACHETEPRHKNAFLFGLSVSAAYILAQWFFSDIDQQLIAYAQKFAAHTVNQYQDILTVIDQQYQCSFDSSTIDALIAKSTEQELCHIAICLWPTLGGQEKVHASLLESISHLSSLLFTLDSYEQILEKQNREHGNTEALLAHLSRFIRQLTALKEKLRFIKQCISTHKSYFVLFETEIALNHKYQIPLEYLELNNDDLKKTIWIRQWALSYNTTIQSIPEMIALLKNDILTLKKAIIITDSEYQYRIHRAKQLADNLTAIKKILLFETTSSE